MTFGKWLSAQMAACGFPTNMALERRTGIDNTTISRWRGDQMTPGMDQLRKLEEPLKTPLLQLLIRAGYVSPEEARPRRGPGEPSEVVLASPHHGGDSEGRPLSVVRGHLEPQTDPDEENNEVLAAIHRDPDLDEDAKAHFLNQYGLLRELSVRKRQAIEQGEQSLLPYVAHGKRTTPVDPEEERAIEERTRAKVRDAQKAPDRDK